mmetsp:Transcript_9085/g.26077  ORF Transcript_9085/g.26077 Transcript_9085/m.26077 type:complete len:219 (+) Transcript_9085:131-787(+)|eukprot:CAMPEP_0170241832 /NCGR_PEP_ID=MMETSP0116_2-20130129/20687_1 /TAXON_ID=400756 /ORGANISM="Durinskia baltica, Strain CSIRO CS-38" /LENGTH=218 /DNA_ID=CAMNT_0010492677 /DNA_START=99 /DNA_END=755 /DNA_ORIENTATION=-
MFACCCLGAQDSKEVHFVSTVAATSDGLGHGTPGVDVRTEEAERPEPFQVTLTRSSSMEPWGLVFHAPVTSTVFIGNVHSEANSVVGAYNAKAPQLERLRPGDCVRGVNGETTPEAMLNSLHMPDMTSLQLTVVRPPVFQVTIPKNGKPLGLSLLRHSSFPLMYVNGIASDCATRTCGADILIGDCVLGVNGIRGEPQELLDLIKASEAPVLTLSRIT